jgi:hypothetical protein
MNTSTTILPNNDRMRNTAIVAEATSVREAQTDAAQGMAKTIETG